MNHQVTANPSETALDQFYMKLALSLARTGGSLYEVPVGAIMVYQQRILATAFNLRESERDPLAHAEIIAISQAAKKLDRWRLDKCELYITLEPCLMCAGAIQQARISRVIYGAKDLKGGAMGSLYDVSSDSRLNHRPQVSAEVLADSSKMLLQSFFRARRN